MGSLKNLRRGGVSESSVGATTGGVAGWGGEGGQGGGAGGGGDHQTAVFTHNEGGGVGGGGPGGGQGGRWGGAPESSVGATKRVVVPPFGLR